MKSRARMAGEPRHFRNIGAADEGRLAGAGEHQRAQVVMGGKLVDGVDEGAHQRGVERVELGAIVEGKIGDRAALALIEPEIDAGRGLAHDLPYTAFGSKVLSPSRNSRRTAPFCPSGAAR